MANYWQNFKNLAPPVRWFILTMATLLALAFLFAPEIKPVDYQAVSFKSTADSRMYFNNIRSYYYHIDTRSKAPTTIYRLKRRSSERDSSNLNFAIVHYPGAEEVFIFASAGKAYEQYDSLRVIFDKYPDAENLLGINREGHFRIAAKVYTSILEEKAVYLAHGDDTLKRLFTNKASSLDAEITLEDYFKLTLKN